MGFVCLGFGLGLLGLGSRLGLLWLLFVVVRLGFGCFSRAGPVRAGFGAVPAGPGPPLWLREAVLRPKAARLAFVVVVCVGLFVVGFGLVWVVCLLWFCTK